jgi:hypothetical protein
MESKKTMGWKHKSTNKLSEKQQAKIGKVMHEFKEGELHSGSKKGPIVTDRDQAIAIALSEANSSKKMNNGGKISEKIKTSKDNDGNWIGKYLDFEFKIYNLSDGWTYDIYYFSPIMQRKETYSSDKDEPAFKSKKMAISFMVDKIKDIKDQNDNFDKKRKNDTEYSKGGYTVPAYDVKTTGVYLFKTKNDSFYLLSYLFERENETEDSIEIQDDLRDKLGSILVQNSSWKRLASGKPVKARSSYSGYIGTLTRVDDTRNVKKYVSGTYNDYEFNDGGGVSIDDIEPLGYKRKDAVEYGKKLLDNGAKYIQVRNKIEEQYAGLRGEIQDVMNDILDYKESKMSTGGNLKYAYTVVWTDRDYKNHKKVFYDDEKGAPENGIIKARKFAKKLEEKDKKDPYGLYRSIEVKYGDEDKMATGGGLNPVNVQNGDIFRNTLNDELIQIEVVGIDSNTKQYILKSYPNSSKESEETLLPYEFNRFYTNGLYEKIDEDQFDKGGTVMVKGNLVKVGDTGVYDGRVKENITVTSISPKIVTFLTSNGSKKGVYTYKFEKFYIPSDIKKTTQDNIKEDLIGKIQIDKIYLIGRPTVTKGGRFNKGVASYKTISFDEDGNKRISSQIFPIFGSAKNINFGEKYIKITQKDFDKMYSNMEVKKPVVEGKINTSEKMQLSTFENKSISELKEWKKDKLQDIKDEAKYLGITPQNRDYIKALNKLDYLVEDITKIIKSDILKNGKYTYWKTFNIRTYKGEMIAEANFTLEKAIAYEHPKFEKDFEEFNKRLPYSTKNDFTKEFIGRLTIPILGYKLSDYTTLGFMKPGSVGGARNNSFENGGGVGLSQNIVVTATGISKKNKEDLIDMGVKLNFQGVGYYLYIKASDKEKVFSYLRKENIDFTNKYSEGGELDKMSLAQLLDKVPIFEQMHIDGYSEFTKQKMVYDDFNNKTGNKHLSFEEKRFYDEISKRKLKALLKYKENIIEWIKRHKKAGKMSNGGKINIGDTWEWHGIEYDQKKGGNYKVVKQVLITNVDSKGQVKGRFVGTANDFIVREPGKYLKKKVSSLSKISEGGGVGSKASNEKLLNSIINGESKSIQGVKMSKKMSEAFLNWLNYSPFGKQNKKLFFNKLLKASFSWGLSRYIDPSLKDEYNRLKEESSKFIDGGQLNDLIEDIKEFENNIYPENSDISYKNRLILATFKRKGYSTKEIVEALKKIRKA